MKSDIPPEERLIHALDVPSEEEGRRLVEALDEAVHFYKVGFELFLAAGFPFTEWLIAQGKKLFLDLKFFDVPATVGAAVGQLRGRGVTFTTVHGNAAILKAAAEAAGEVKVLGVTVLTSLDAEDLRSMGLPVSPEALVLERARLAAEAGCFGVVASGLEARAIREALGEDLAIVTPGVRPIRVQDDQKRVVGVEEAFANGADYIVVGRPIRSAEDPKRAALDIQARIRRVFQR